MDPDAALADVRLLVSERRFETACEQFNYLDKWLSSGGFLPAVWNRHRRETL